MNGGRAQTTPVYGKRMKPHPTQAIAHRPSRIPIFLLFVVFTPVKAPNIPNALHAHSFLMPALCVCEHEY